MHAADAGLAACKICANECKITIPSFTATHITTPSLGEITDVTMVRLRITVALGKGTARSSSRIDRGKLSTKVYQCLDPWYALGQIL